MIASRFKSVGWVGAVAAAALGCYMLSLNVAAERADLASVERKIIVARQDIRALQTELGTRGRLTQLERWNADVLALSAPVSRQFLQNEFRLASYTEPQRSPDEHVAQVRMASADTTAPSQPIAKPAIVTDFPAEAGVQPQAQLVHKASLVKAAATVPVLAKPANVASAPVRKASLIGGDLARQISAAADAEQKSKSRGAGNQ